MTTTEAEIRAARRAAKEFVDSVAPGHTVTISSGGKSATIEGGKGVVGTQTAIDMETGEIMDADVIRELYTETSIAGKLVTSERCKLGERVRVTLTARVVAKGQAIGKDNIKVHVQKLSVESIEDIERGAL